MKLRPWLDNLRAASKVDRTKAVVDALRSKATIAEWASEDEEEVEAWVVDAGPILTQRVADQIVKAVRKVAKGNADRKKERLRLADEDEEHPEIGAALSREDLPHLAVPNGWTCDDRGICFLATKKVDGEDVTIPVRVSHRPILTTGVLIGVDTGDREIVLEWPNDRGDGWTSAVVRSSMTQDPKQFLALRDRGAPVSGAGARDLARWLDDLEERNAMNIPRAWHTNRLGWQGEKGRLGYLWGRSLMTPGGSANCDEPPAKWETDHVRLSVPELDGRQQLVNGCAGKGDWYGWVETIKLLTPYPRVMLGIYASLAACCLGLIPEAPTPIIDWSGETSRGKTTTLCVAASVWGRPELRGAGIMRTWDVSAAALESLAETCTDLPLILDDTKRATTRGRAEDVSSIIYQVAAGQGRGRGRPDGMRNTAIWRTMLLSTGEAPATSFSNDAGSRGRVLSIVGAPLPDDSEKLVRRVEVGIRDNYGLAGPRFVRWILDHPTQANKLKARYPAACAEWAAIVDAGPVGGRLAQILALLEIGATALHEILGIPRPDEDPIATVAVAACRAGASDSDRPKEALRAVYEWSVGRQSEFWGRHATNQNGDPIKPPPKGWAGAWRRDAWDEIAYIPTVLRRILEHHSYAPADVIPRWQERGWILGERENITTRDRSIDGEKMRCVVISREFLEIAAGVRPG